MPEMTSRASYTVDNNASQGLQGLLQSPEPAAALHARKSTSVALDCHMEKPTGLVWRITVVASISGFMFGYDTGYISSVLVTVGADLGMSLSTNEKELVSSATSMGALLVSPVSGFLVDAIGRRLTIIVCDLLFVFGASLQCFSHSVSIMILGRLIMGFGVGIGSLCAPLYIGELAPGKFRGPLVVLNCVAITVGQLVAYGIGALFSNVNNGWRIVIGLSILPCMLQFCSILSLPDTPRYLIMRRRFAEAFDALKLLYPNASNALIDANIEELGNDTSIWQNDDSFTSQIGKAWHNLLNIRSNRRGLIIACGLQLIQQLSGFNALMYFSSSIFEMVGYKNSTLVSCFVAGTNFIVTCIALVIINKVGRRRILLFSLPLLGASQLLCAWCFQYLDVATVDSSSLMWKWLLVLAISSFVAFYAIGIGNVPWQQSELFPQDVRGLGSSLATCSNWFGSLCISISFLSLVEILSASGTFLLFCGITFLSWIFILLTYPELNGLTLEEVEEILDQPFNKGIELSLKFKEQRNNWSERSRQEEEDEFAIALN